MLHYPTHLMNYPMIVQAKLLIILCALALQMGYSQNGHNYRLIEVLPSFNLVGNLLEHRNTNLYSHEIFQISPGLGINIRHQRIKTIYNLSIFSIINTFSSRNRGFVYNCQDCSQFQIPFLDNYTGNLSVLQRVHKSEVYLEGLFQGSILNNNRNTPGPLLLEASGIKSSLGVLTMGVGFRKRFVLNKIECHLKSIPYWGILLRENYHFGEYFRAGLLCEIEIMFNLTTPHRH